MKPESNLLLALGLARFLLPGDLATPATQESVVPILAQALPADWLPGSVQGDLIAHLPAPTLRDHLPLWIHVARNPSSPVQPAAVWALGFAGGHEAASALEEVLRNPGNSVPIRADALIARAMASTHDIEFAKPFAESTEPDIRHAARLVLGRTRDGEATDRPTSLAEWQAAVATGGNPARGRRLFLSPQIGCAKCHTAEGRGARSAPSLLPSPTPSSRAALVESILEPSVRITPGFESWIVETQEENTLTGILARRAPNGDVLLIESSGQPRRIPAADVTQFGPLPQSLMPEGMVETLSVQDLRDLVAFLTPTP